MAFWLGGPVSRVRCREKDTRLFYHDAFPEIQDRGQCFWMFCSNRRIACGAMVSFTQQVLYLLPELAYLPYCSYAKGQCPFSCIPLVPWASRHLVVFLNEWP